MASTVIAGLASYSKIAVSGTCIYRLQGSAAQGGGVGNMGSTGRAQSAEDLVMDRILPGLGQNCKK